MEEAFTSEHWIVRIYKVKPRANLQPTATAAKKKAGGGSGSGGSKGKSKSGHQVNEGDDGLCDVNTIIKTPLIYPPSHLPSHLSSHPNHSLIPTTTFTCPRTRTPPTPLFIRPLSPFSFTPLLLSSSSCTPSHPQSPPHFTPQDSEEKAPDDARYVGCFASESSFSSDKIYEGGTTGANYGLALHHAKTTGKRYFAIAKAHGDGHSFSFNRLNDSPRGNIRRRRRLK